MENKSQFTSPENYSDWFALYLLSKHFKLQQSIKISSAEFGSILSVSQQTGSRRIQNLAQLGWITKKIDGKSQIIQITNEGIKALFTVFRDLRDCLEHMQIVGEIVGGMGEGGYYVSIKDYYIQFEEKLGYKPYKGTLNLKLSELDMRILREMLSFRTSVKIRGFRDEQREYGSVNCYDVCISPLNDINKELNAAILDIKRTHHKKNIIEILAKEYIREYFNLKDGDKVVIKFKNSNH